MYMYIMVGYNVLEMYLRTIGFFCHSKGMWKKITLGGPHFRNEQHNLVEMSTWVYK